MMDLSSQPARDHPRSALVRTGADGNGRKAAIEILINTHHADKLLKGDFTRSRPIPSRVSLGMRRSIGRCSSSTNEGLFRMTKRDHADSANVAAFDFKFERTRQPS